MKTKTMTWTQARPRADADEHMCAPVCRWFILPLSSPPSLEVRSSLPPLPSCRWHASLPHIQVAARPVAKICPEILPYRECRPKTQKQRKKPHGCGCMDCDCQHECECQCPCQSEHESKSESKSKSNSKIYIYIS